MNKVGWLLALVLLTVSCGNAGADRSAGSARDTDSYEVSRPVGVDIAAIGVHVEELQTVRSGSDSGDECPQDPAAVAWNADGTLPGEPGLALLVASAKGAFARLSDLKPDDPIVVMRADGSRATFKKSASAQPAPGTRPARLQLTACGGSASQSVYADLAP